MQLESCLYPDRATKFFSVPKRDVLGHQNCYVFPNGIQINANKSLLILNLNFFILNALKILYRQKLDNLFIFVLLNLVEIRQKP